MKKDYPFVMNSLRIGFFLIDLLHLMGKIAWLSFENKKLKALLLIELRKYKGATLGLSLRDKYRLMKGRL